MSAASYDFEIEQGTTLSKPVSWTDSVGVPVNLTGYSAKMQIRRNIAATDILLELSTITNTLIITPLTGVITMALSATATAAITWSNARYDLELTSADGTVTRLLEGRVSISKEVTR